MSTDYGNQIYKTGDTHTEDPEKNFRFVARLGNDDTDGHSRFVVPDDKYPLKPDQLLFLMQFEIPSNYVPDNDMPAKMIKKLEVKILENLVFQCYNNYEYFFLNHFLTKLNYSNLSQDTELFYKGRFDHFDIHADMMQTQIVRYNGKNVMENRQIYADEAWVASDVTIPEIGGLSNVKTEAKSYVYSFKCPIAHGITRQPKVIPPGSKLEFDMTFHDPEYMLMKPSEWREYRFKSGGNAIFNPDELKWSQKITDLQIMTELKYEYHDFADSTTTPCMCIASEFGPTFGTVRAEKITPIKGQDNTYPDITKVMTDKTEHYAVRRVPKIRIEPVLAPDGSKLYDYVYFFKKYDLGANSNDNDTSSKAANTDMTSKAQIYKYLKKIELESVFCNASKKDMPVSTGKKKIKLPIYYPRLQIKTLRSGLSTYEIELVCGTLPHMIIFSGKSHNSNSDGDFSKCVTQTSLNEPGFEIIDFNVFLNNRRILRTPWNHGLDHYINFIKHTGRYENKALGGSTDYFNFLNTNWCVPIRFGENEGRDGTVTVQLTFSKTLDENNLWDAFIMSIPSANLLLDGNTNGKSHFVIICKINF